MSIKRNPTAYDMIRDELDRYHSGTNSLVGITSMSQYGDGMLVQYYHTYNALIGNKARKEVTEKRCAYYVLDVQHAQPITVVRKWDMIC